MKKKSLLTSELPLRIFRYLKREAPYYKQLINHTLSARLSPLSGLTKIKRNQPLIVSLTTIPARFEYVHLCIDSLLRQQVKPDHIILWLSESIDPITHNVTKPKLPELLLHLQKRGLEIRWCEDIRSYRKLIPTLLAYPQALIVTADDDCFYPNTWLGDLLTSYNAEPQYIHCHRAHLMKLDDGGYLKPYSDWVYGAQGIMDPSIMLFPTGVGGVLYAPDHLDNEVFNANIFQSICPTADDIWYKAMSLKAGILCKKVNPDFYEYTEIREAQHVALSTLNVDQNHNDRQLKAVFDKYQLWNTLPNQ